jgi:sulfatase maturation enzyme AslB (radical SAM superfamily)
VSIFKNFIKTGRKCRRKFLVNMVYRGMLGFRKFRKRRKKGLLFPAFQFISITNDCNLRCQGCWVSTDGAGQYMPLDKINSIIEAGKKQGTYFFGILGGEPLMYKQLADIYQRNTFHQCLCLSTPQTGQYHSVNKPGGRRTGSRYPSRRTQHIQPYTECH